MRRGLLFVASHALVACVSLDGLTGAADEPPPGTAPAEAPPSAALPGTAQASTPGAKAGGAVGACDASKPFTVTALPASATNDDLFAARRNADETWLVLSRRAVTSQPLVIAGATIDQATSNGFQTIVLQGAAEYPTLAPGDLTLYFQVDAKNSPAFAIRRATRGSTDAEFLEDSTFELDSSTSVTRFPYVVATGAALYYTDGNDNASTIMRTPLPTPSLGAPVLAHASHPVVTPDELTMYFASRASGDADVWVATRASTNDPFGPPTLVSVVSTPGVDEEPTWISHDGCALLFQRVVGEHRVVMEATR